MTSRHSSFIVATMSARKAEKESANKGINDNTTHIEDAGGHQGIARNTKFLRI